LTSRAHSDLELYWRLLRWARPFRAHLTGFFFLSLLSTPLALLGPVPLKIAVDEVLGEGRIDLLPLAAGLLVLIAVLRETLDLAITYSSTYIGQRIVLAFRTRLFSHAQRLSFAFHDSKGTAESVYRILWDAPAIQHVAVNGVIPLVTAALTIVAMIFVTARIDWALAVVALLITPVLFYVTRSYRKPLRVRYRRLSELEKSALSIVQEVLGALRVVKAFGREEREAQRFEDHSTLTLRVRERLTLFQGGFDILVGLTTAAGTAVVLYLGVDHVQKGVLTLGELLVVMAYLAQLYAPMRTITSKAADIQSSLTSAERAFALLDEAPEVPERPHARPLARAEGRIEFRRVRFGYDPARPVVRDVSLAVPPGARVGISGVTGAGKTTLVNLLTRFYDPDEGAVLLDGVDVRDYRLADLRNQFAIVLQDPVLFSTSIAENIAYARPSASREDIEAAARAANAHDFIAALPEGYDTAVGERGMRLSGGERQRVSLARAFLKDAPILILDEPTSSVDVETEATIMEAMKRLMRNRTTFMIAHRMSTLDHCDVRIDVDQGRITISPLISA